VVLAKKYTIRLASPTPSARLMGLRDYFLIAQPPSAEEHLSKLALTGWLKPKTGTGQGPCTLSGCGFMRTNYLGWLAFGGVKKKNFEIGRVGQLKIQKWKS
jgi:hypothetical protein